MLTAIDLCPPSKTIESCTQYNWYTYIWDPSTIALQRYSVSMIFTFWPQMTFNHQTFLYSMWSIISLYMTPVPACALEILCSHGLNSLTSTELSWPLTYPPKKRRHLELNMIDIRTKHEIIPSRWFEIICTSKVWQTLNATMITQAKVGIKTTNQWQFRKTTAISTDKGFQYHLVVVYC